MKRWQEGSSEEDIEEESNDDQPSKDTKDQGTTESEDKVDRNEEREVRAISIDTYDDQPSS